MHSLVCMHVVAFLLLLNSSLYIVTGTLKDINNKILQKQRAIQLQQRKATYKWLKLPFSPSG